MVLYVTTIQFLLTSEVFCGSRSKLTIHCILLTKIYDVAPEEVGIPEGRLVTPSPNLMTINFVSNPAKRQTEPLMLIHDIEMQMGYHISFWQSVS